MAIVWPSIPVLTSGVGEPARQLVRQGRSFPDTCWRGFPTVRHRAQDYPSARIVFTQKVNYRGLSSRKASYFGMSILRRLTAVGVSLLVLQGTLAGRGDACQSHDTGTAKVHDVMAMPAPREAMPMSPATTAHAAPEAGESASCDSGAPNDGCAFPGSTGPCDMAGACAPSIPGVRVIMAQGLIEPSGTRAGLALDPPTRSTAPEPPPPRA